MQIKHILSTQLKVYYSLMKTYFPKYSCPRNNNDKEFGMLDVCDENDSSVFNSSLQTQKF